jgi:NADH-quinone oxidoreductase subunit N
MTETFQVPALLPALPEIVLVIGAMLLLMVGAFRGERAASGIDGTAILLLTAFPDSSSFWRSPARPPRS